MARLDGVDRLLATVGGLSKRLEDGARSTNRDLAEQVAADMRMNVPTDTGRLASTIRVVDDGDGKVAAIAGDDTTEYAGFVEFGTSRTEAQPFARPAAANAETRLEQAQLAEARKRVGR